ncbi:MAG TPA: sigma-70 family RNA polymerase sigma factor [Ktedonobacterales bacterium]|nr:sigma-70 family RNA polymerase sigma factor [Ktedonobacterales bacterium]
MLSWRRNKKYDASHEAKHPSFEQLLKQARQGEAESLSALYHQFLPGVFSYIAARVPDRHTAEDLTSEVFLKMVEGIHRLQAQEEANFAAWLFRIARITVAGYYRQREHQPTLLSLASPLFDDEHSQGPLVLLSHHPEDDPVRWAEARAEWSEVVQAINQLTEDQRQVLIGRLVMGYDVRTVARMLGKQPNAIKALQFRGLQALHRLLQRKTAPSPPAPTGVYGRRDAP